jgi:hypothetical protein
MSEKRQNQNVRARAKRNLLNILIYTFTVEKALQHLFTAIFFIVDIPGIGTPDIGTTFQISNSIMALLNLVYFTFFLIGIIGKNKKKKWAMRLIIVLACLDIILEFIFHGFFFITVSVIISTILTIISILYLRINKETESIEHS